MTAGESGLLVLRAAAKPGGGEGRATSHIRQRSGDPRPLILDHAPDKVGRAIQSMS